jgi:ABC-2 type transport system permease protein
VNGSAAPDLHKTSVITESAVLAGRLFAHWRSYPMVPVQSVLFPTLLLITYSLLVGKSMTRVTGDSKVDLLVALCAIGGAMVGTMNAAFGITHDRNCGFMTRIWVLPIHRYSAVGGTVLAECLRTLLGTAVITAVGFALGFRFHSNVFALIVFVLIPVAVVTAYALIVLTIAVVVDSRAFLTWLNTVVLGLVFSTAAPAEVVPAAVRPLMQYQPLYAPVQSMRLLAQGESAALQVAVTAAWVVFLVAVFTPLAIRGYRKAAETASKA